MATHTIYDRSKPADPARHGLPTLACQDAIHYAVDLPNVAIGNDLPAGLQILGRPFAEGDLFRLAYAYEQATRHRHPPHLFPELE